jgi:hypothetical protein
MNAETDIPRSAATRLILDLFATVTRTRLFLEGFIDFLLEDFRHGFTGSLRGLLQFGLLGRRQPDANLFLSFFPLSRHFGTL